MNFQREKGIGGKIILILDNAPSHPPLEELNALNENVEVLYLPPNVTALIQPMDQGPISLVKKYYKKNLLRNLIFADKLEGADTFLKNLNYHDCFPILNETWNTLKESTLQMVWKRLLGDSCQPVTSQQPLDNSTQNVHSAEIVEVEDLANIAIPQEISDNLSRLCSQPNFFIENSEEVFRSWFETEDEDCGWEPLSESDIVKFIQNNRVAEEEEIEETVTEAENSSNAFLEKGATSPSEAYDGLQIFKSYVRQQATPENYHKILICFDEVKKIIESQKSSKFNAKV